MGYPRRRSSAADRRAGINSSQRSGARPSHAPAKEIIMLQNTLNRARKVHSDEGGFTLIELLLVIVILGVLSAVVVFSVRGITDRGDIAACKTNVSTAQTAVEAYYAKNGSNPATLADVVPDFLK